MADTATAPPPVVDDVAPLVDAENATEAINGTLGKIPSTPEGMLVAYGSLVVMALIYSTGNISGTHINPAVTLGFFFAGRFPGASVMPYITAQVTGALIAAAMLRFLFPEHGTLGATLPAMPVASAFVIEVVISFVLMFVVLNVSTGHMEKGIMAGAAVGGVVAMHEGMRF